MKEKKERKKKGKKKLKQKKSGKFMKPKLKIFHGKIKLK